MDQITTVEQLVEKLTDLTASSEQAATFFASDPGGSMDYFGVLDGQPLTDTEKDTLAAAAFERMGW